MTGINQFIPTIEEFLNFEFGTTESTFSGDIVSSQVISGYSYVPELTGSVVVPDVVTVTHYINDLRYIELTTMVGVWAIFAYIILKPFIYSRSE